MNSSCQLLQVFYLPFCKAIHPYLKNRLELLLLGKYLVTVGWEGEILETTGKDLRRRGVIHIFCLMETTKWSNMNSPGLHPGVSGVRERPRRGQMSTCSTPPGSFPTRILPRIACLPTGRHPRLFTFNLPKIGTGSAGFLGYNLWISFAAF
jgi:hypothetical protein